MARKGENIYKRKDGRWEARYEKGRNSKGQIIYGSLYGKSYREVREKKINSIVKLPVTKTISPSESVNICDVSTRWLESIRHMGVVDNASNENNENTRRKATVVPIKIKYV